MGSVGDSVWGSVYMDEAALELTLDSVHVRHDGARCGVCGCDGGDRG